MIAVEDITRVAEAWLCGRPELFLVEVKDFEGEGFEVFVDCDGVGEDGKPRRVSVEDCIELTRAIRASFEQGDGESELDDYSLTVSSAGVGQPLRILRQYRKLIGKQVDMTFKSGKKLTATLEDADGESVTIDGETIPLTDIKSTKEHINFK